MIQKIIKLIAVSFLLVISCSSPESKAKEALSDMGLTFDHNSFVDCVVQGRAKAVKYFLLAGMSADGRSSGMPPLVEASRRSHTAIALTLIDFGAEVNAKDRYGVTALMYAAISGSPEIMERLIKEGADVNAKDIDGRTALVEALASENSCPPGLIRSLLERGADPNVTFYGGLTPIMLAATGSSEVVEMLIEAGADVNRHDERGTTALQRARHRPENIRILQSSGAEE
jgi:ankyrin repeat protein